MLLQVILEGIGLGVLLILVCAIGVRKNAVGMVHLYSPEGGSAGGQIVAEGTPEEVAANPTSFTGQYLGPILKRDRAKSGETGQE